MESFYIEQTLNALKEDADCLLSAEESLKYLYSLAPDNVDYNALSAEMRQAFLDLKNPCESYIAAYHYYAE